MEKIIYNGKIHTMNVEMPLVEAIYIKENKIIAIGGNSEIMGRRSPDTLVIDAKGEVVIPGFNDAHMHLLKAGISMQYIDLTGVDSIENLIVTGKKHLEENPPEKGEWVLGRGWNQFYFKEKRVPDKKDLDQITTENPIAFIRLCEHTVSVNTKALEIAGITKDTAQPQGGEFELDEKGNPTGVFKDIARDLIYSSIVEPDISQIKNYIIKAANIAAENGITSLQTDDFWSIPSKDFKKIIKAYHELEEEEALPVRIYEQCVLEGKAHLEQFLSESYTTGCGSNFFKIGPFKAFVDGAMGSRTAYFDEAYADDEKAFGLTIHTYEELLEIMEMAHKSHMQLIAHAIGSKAIAMCFQIYNQISEGYPTDDFRPAIIHAQATTAEQNFQFSKQGVIAVIDPSVLNDDIHMVEQRIGRARVEKAYNYRSLIDNNSHIAISSDWPINNINPMCSLYLASTRRDYKGFPPDGWFPEQIITVEEAVRAFTIDSAYLSMEEGIKGSLEIGKLADLVILSEDIFQIEKEKLLDIKVLLTMVDGKIKYRNTQMF